jgi:hypothetical protein
MKINLVESWVFVLFYFLVQVTVQFIRRGQWGEKREGSISCSHSRKWEQRL